MHKPYLIAAAVFGGLAVALGAFGAHALEKITTDPVILHGYQTAVQYQFYHALALLGAGLLPDRFPLRWIKWAGRCFISGILLFSGSLYLLTFLKIHESEAIRFAGPVTPVGGLLFMAGWLFLLVAFTGKK
jgi:uncharacterized membrane protein YgdD (TMEM256/DUF423 family)